MRRIKGIWAHKQARRLAVTGAVSVLAGASLIGFATVSQAEGGGDNNTTCAEQGYTSGVKFERSDLDLSGALVQYTRDGFTVSIKVTDPGSGEVIDWSGANPAVDAVIAKGGSGGFNVYTYDPAATTGSVHTPATPSEKWAELSHIDFCFGLTSTTSSSTSTSTSTSTTSTSTTSTTTSTTTTTLPGGGFDISFPTTAPPVTGQTIPPTTEPEEPTTTEPPVTAVTVPPTTAAPETTAAVPVTAATVAELAYTGGSDDASNEQVLLGIALMGFGLLFLVGSHRRAVFHHGS
jgi:hypothetical protein